MRLIEVIADADTVEAPTGQRFCVVPVANGHFETTANHWD